MTMSRRQFLKRSALASAAAMFGPQTNFLQGPGVSWAAGPSDAIVVFVQLFGGNDGINTVYPLSGPQRSVYTDVRPTLALPDTVGGLASYPAGNLASTFGLPSEILDLGTNLNGSNYALHPAMQSWWDIWNDGELAVVPGVHYPHANQSHFRSEDIYYSGDPLGAGGFGWFGRYMDLGGFSATEVPGMIYGGNFNPLFTPTETSLFAFRRLSDLVYPSGRNADVRQAAFRDLALDAAGLDPALFGEHVAVGNLGTATMDAIGDYYLPGAGLETAGKVEALLLGENEDYSDNNSLVYDSPLNPESNPRVADLGLAKALRHVAATIRADVGARFFHVGLGGFDNHSNQENGLFHSSLLRQVSEATGAFWGDMKSSVSLPSGYSGYRDEALSDKVIIVTLSEFGRTVRQNATGATTAGTDHATSSTQFVIGETVNGGVHGSYPLLDDPHPERRQHELRMETDFRDFYGTMLERWLNVAPANIDPAVGGTLFPATTIPDKFGDTWTNYQVMNYLTA